MKDLRKWLAVFACMALVLSVNVNIDTTTDDGISTCKLAEWVVEVK